jgi:hypothetical protein
MKFATLRLAILTLAILAQLYLFARAARLRCSVPAKFLPVPLRFLILKETPVAPGKAANGIFGL